MRSKSNGGSVILRPWTARGASRMEEVDGKGEERGIKGVGKTNMCKVGGKVDDSLHDTPDECVKRALGGRHPLLQYYKFTKCE